MNEIKAYNNNNKPISIPVLLRSICFALTQKDGRSLVVEMLTVDRGAERYAGAIVSPKRARGKKRIFSPGLVFTEQLIHEDELKKFWPFRRP